jgi:hypothetical protein
MGLVIFVYKNAVQIGYSAKMFRDVQHIAGFIEIADKANGAIVTVLALRTCRDILATEAA